MYNILMYCYEWPLLVAAGLLLISALQVTHRGAAEEPQQNSQVRPRLPARAPHQADHQRPPGHLCVKRCVYHSIILQLSYQIKLLCSFIVYGPSIIL